MIHASLVTASLGLFLAGAAFLPCEIHAQTAAPGESAAQSAATNSQWPQATQVNDRGYKVFEPQFESMSGSAVTMSAAVEISARDGSVRRGIAAITGNATPSDVPGELEINGLEVNSVSFGDAVDDTAAADLTGALIGMAFTVDRATLVEDMALANPRGSSTPGLSAAVPSFYFSPVSAVLVAIDGNPIKVPAGKGGWSLVKNTPYTVFTDPNGAWVVQVGASNWMGSPNATGPFVTVAAPPSDAIAALGTAPDSSKTIGTPPAPSHGAPKLPANLVIVTKPTVLIALDGAPSMNSVGNGLFEVTNANNILLMQSGDTTSWWTVAAGRWFTAASLNGPWSLVAPSALPASFQSLPATGRLAVARASVPGTTEASDAAIAANEIRTVTVKPDVACEVSYNGSPAFVPIAGSPCSYAANSSNPVIQVPNRGVYCCANGIWFEASQPTGPWKVSVSIPDAVYRIPASSPVYSVTYVRVYGSTRDASGALTGVTFGFSSGYLGTYLNEGTPVYGTGYDYANASDPNNYQAYPSTYDNPVAYDQQTGTYSPPGWYDGYPYDYPYVQPYYLDNGWAGWGWCGGWATGWGWGWNNWSNWNHWGPCWNHFHPYWNPAWHNDWQRNHRLYENGRGGNALNNQPQSGAWKESNDWKQWNDASNRGNEPQNQESADWKQWNAASNRGDEPQNQESPDWQKWNAASNRGDEPQNQRPVGQPTNFYRNQGYDYSGNSTRSMYGNSTGAWGAPSSNAWQSYPRTGTSGIHPAYRSTGGGMRGGAVRSGGGGGRR